MWLSAVLLSIATPAHAQVQVYSSLPALPNEPQSVNNAEPVKESISTKEAAPPLSVQALLSKMSQNAPQMNYRGAFTYQNQTSIELKSFKVEHWIENGSEHERFLFLNGPERLIARDGQPVDCLAMGDKLRGNGFPQMGKALVKLDELYQFEIRSQERIAGRLARVLQVIPKDIYRYGYFLSIDEETGLVLKSWLIDENAHPLERYQFVTFELIPDASQFHLNSSTHQHKALAEATPCNPTEMTDPAEWLLSWVPSGFLFAGQRQLANGQTMLMYTDGLTTFSVFVEPTSSFVPEGVGRRGATLAYMHRLVADKIVYRVSVVGEIPLAAASKIAQNILRKPQS